VSDCETVTLPSGDTVSSVEDETSPGSIVVCEVIGEVVAEVVDPEVESSGLVLLPATVELTITVVVVITVLGGSTEERVDSDGDKVETSVTVVMEKTAVLLILGVTTESDCSEVELNEPVGTEIESSVLLLSPTVDDTPSVLDTGTKVVLLLIEG
jgi:hypothetical protein